MADFHQAFNKIFKKYDLNKSDELINIFSTQEYNLKRSQLCWNKMRKLGFSYNEILTYIKWVWCKEVWDEISADNINHQLLAESMFTFSLNNGSDHCLYILSSTLRPDSGPCVLHGDMAWLNEMNGNYALLQFGMAKIIYYNLSNKYHLSEENILTGINC